MLASQTLKAATLTSCSNEAQVSLRASFCLADWATLPVVASTASPANTDTCLLKASATLSALCCPCTKAYCLVLGKVNLLLIMVQPERRIAKCMRKIPTHASVQHTDMQCVCYCSISSIHDDHALCRSGLSALIAGLQQLSDRLCKVTLQERRKASKSALASALTWPLLAVCSCCTMAGSKVAALNNAQRAMMSSKSFLHKQERFLQTQQLYKLRSTPSGHCECQACSIGKSHGHLHAANWHERCTLTLCQ